MQFLEISTEKKAKIISEAKLSVREIDKSEILSIKDFFSGVGLNIDLDLTNLILLNKELTEEQKFIIDEILAPTYQKIYENFDQELVKIPTQNSKEKLVSIRDIVKSRDLKVSFNDSNYPDYCGEYANKPREFYFREKLTEPFIKFCELISKLDLSVFIIDTYRPKVVQESLYLNTFKRIKNSYPNLKLEELIIETNSKTAFSPWSAGHMTGAAIDLCIMKNGEFINMGNDFRTTGASCNMNYPFLTIEHLKSRSIFNYISIASGFSIYPAEDWHISLGDITANFNSKDIANYGPIKEFDIKSGNIVPYNSTEYYQNFFDKKYLSNQ